MNTFKQRSTDPPMEVLLDNSMRLWSVEIALVVNLIVDSVDAI
ncbi:hypothetical protein [Leptolyngbya iicbica]|nr:hypothetical protein [Leptolyngbya sp. LK]